MRLETTKKVQVLDKTFMVHFQWRGHRELIDSAAHTETVKFQAAMRDSSEMPDTVVSHYELEGDR